jgi:hypothetical protein
LLAPGLVVAPAGVALALVLLRCCAFRSLGLWSAALLGCGALSLRCAALLGYGALRLWSAALLGCGALRLWSAALFGCGALCLWSAALFGCGALCRCRTLCLSRAFGWRNDGPGPVSRWSVIRRPTCLGPIRGRAIAGRLRPIGRLRAWRVDLLEPALLVAGRIAAAAIAALVLGQRCGCGHAAFRASIPAGALL